MWEYYHPGMSEQRHLVRHLSSCLHPVVNMDETIYKIHLHGNCGETLQIRAETTEHGRAVNGAYMTIT
jgi:hypothetical protein